MAENIAPTTADNGVRNVLDDVLAGAHEPAQDARHTATPVSDSAPATDGASYEVTARYTEPTIEVLIPGKLVVMDMIEDALDGFDGWDEFGVETWPEKDRIIAEGVAEGKWSPDAQLAYENHKKAWFDNIITKKDGSEGGILLVPGGPEAVRAKAAELRKENPDWANIGKKKRGRKKGHPGRPRKKQGSDSETGEDGDDKALTSKRRMIFAALDLAPEHFKNLTDKELWALEASASTANAYPFGMVLLRRLMSKGEADKAAATEAGKDPSEVGFEPETAWAIVHDKDLYTIEDFDAGLCSFAQVNALKRIHIHILIRAVAREHGVSVREAAEAWGIEENFIRFPKDSNGTDLEKGRYAFENQGAYLPHAKQPEKHLYPFSQVATLFGADYRAWAEAHFGKWTEFRAKKEAVKDVEHIQTFIDGCRFGEILKEQIMAPGPDGTLRTNPLYRIYTGFYGEKMDKPLGPVIDRMLREAAAGRMGIAVHDLEKGLAQKVILFVTGKAGMGKSVFAEGLCRALADLYGYRTYRAASRNAVDDYDGAEIMLMDDVRGAALGIEDWLTLLDPHHANPMAARYKNKPALAPRVIVITSSKSPLEFFYFAKGIGGGDRAEAMDQFFRRIMLQLRVLNPYEFGFYNIQALRPQRVAPYELEVPGSAEDEFEGLDVITGLEWAQVPLPGLTSPYGVVANMLAEIDDVAGKRALAEGMGIEAATTRALSVMYATYRAPMEAHDLPLFPSPLSGVALSLEGASIDDPGRYGLPGGPAIPLALPAGGDGHDDQEA